MTLKNYWWLLIWLFIVGGFTLVYPPQREEIVLGKKHYRWNRIAAWMLAVPYVIWAGGRKWFGDTEQYRGTFLGLPSQLSQIGAYMKGVRKGHGFRLLELLFKCLISKSDVVFFLFIAAIQIGCLVYIYRKYSRNYWFSFFLFIASTDYLSWVFNGMRQFIAVTIIFLCVPLIARRKYIPTIIIVLLMSTVHISALFFLPFVFIVNGKAWNARTLLFLAGVIIAVALTDRITGFLINIMEDTAYEGDIVFLKYNDGTHILRVLLYSVPAIMSFVFRPYLDRADDPLINVCANLSIVTAGFYVFSFFTSGILMGSVPILFSLANYILVPWLIHEVFDPASALVAEAGFVGVYSVFFYYQMGPTWGLL